MSIQDLEPWEVDKLWRERERDSKVLRLNRFRRGMLVYIATSVVLGIVGALVAGAFAEQGVECVFLSSLIGWFVITCVLSVIYAHQAKRLVGEGATPGQIAEACEGARARAALRDQLIEAQRARGGELSRSGGDDTRGAMTQAGDRGERA